MAWIAAHWVGLMSAWMVVHVIAQAVHAKAPETTWYGKTAAFWSAVNPLDVVKAFKAFGVELAVPVACLALILLPAAVTLSCTPAKVPETTALDTASENVKLARYAFGACAVERGIADKLRGDTGTQTTVDEIVSCGPALLALARAEVMLHQAEQAALATLDGGRD